MLDVQFLIQYEQFYHCFQPLYDLSEGKKRYGFESLLRSSAFRDPQLFFRKAKEAEKLFELDTKSISKAVLSYHLRGCPDEFLFVNVFPSTIMEASFFPFVETMLKYTPITAERIVFELNESEELSNLCDLSERTESLKNMGFSIAVDDVGRGASSLRVITELEPDYIKVDRYFSHHLSISDKKQRMVEFLTQFCGKDILLVLEGIEKEEDLAKANELGVNLAQGYYLGKPVLLSGIHSYQATM